MAITKVSAALADLDGAVVINESGADVDFRVESDGNPNMFTIDAGNNDVLIGNTVAAVASSFDNQAGFSYQSEGVVQIANTNDAATLVLGKNQGTEGNWIDFRKQSTSIGQIGTIGTNDIMMFSNAANHVGLRLGEGYYIPTDNVGSANDNAVDLGLTSIRYKDIYLGGGAYLGGTGSANHLDDYEEGSFTPTLSFGGGTTGIGYSFQEGRYIKIGKLVHIQILIALSSKGSSTGDAKLTVPFAIDNISGSTQWEAPASFFLLVGNSNLGNSIPVFSDTQAGIIWADTQVSSTEATNSIFTDTTNFRITGQYQTSA